VREALKRPTKHHHETSFTTKIRQERITGGVEGDELVVDACHSGIADDGVNTLHTRRNTN